MIRVPGDVRIRTAREADVEGLLPIHMAVFPDARGREARRRNFCENPRGGIEDLHVAEVSGRLVGHGFLFPMETWIGGRTVGVGGVASIGVVPESRRAGIAHALLLHLVQKLRARGTPLSMLYPFRHDFYRSMGWGLTSAMHRHRLRPAAFPEHRERGRVRPLEPADLGAVRRCYERFAAAGTGLLGRAEPVWQAMLSPDLVRVAVVPSAETARTVDGYLVYRMVPDGGSQAIELEVIELVALGDDARLALLGFLSAQRDHVSRVQLVVPADEPLLAALSDPRGVSTELVRGLLMVAADLVVGAMTRIVDLSTALRVRGWDGPDGEVALRMEDTLVPENAQPVTLRVRAHAGEVEPGRRDGVPLLEADAGVMAQIYMGHLRPSQAVGLRLARLDPPNAAPMVDALLATRPALTLDVF